MHDHSATSLRWNDGRKASCAKLEKRMAEEKIAVAVKTPKPPKVARYQSLADLIRDAYGPTRKRLSLSKADLQTMQSTARLDPAQAAELLKLASGDRTLDRTRDLILLGAERISNQPLAGELRSFVSDVLRRHPAFAAPEMDGVLKNLPDAIGDDEAVRALFDRSFATLVWP